MSSTESSIPGGQPSTTQPIAGPCDTIAAEGGKADIAKPMHGLGSGVMEIALAHKGNAFRVVYAAKLGEDLWVVHAFKKKSTQGVKDAEARDRSDQGSAETIEGGIEMKSERIAVTRGKGNVYRDLGKGNADLKQFKAILAAEIVKVLDRDELTVRQAHARTGIAAADFSRIRSADLDRFTADRLMSIINRLGSRVDVAVKVKRSVGPQPVHLKAARSPSGTKAPRSPSP
ncbi:MAG: XRE family transcriptional regulator [Usitatibacter sp.]